MIGEMILYIHVLSGEGRGWLKSNIRVNAGVCGTILGKIWSEYCGSECDDVKDQCLVLN